MEPSQLARDDAVTPVSDISTEPISFREAFWYWLRLGFISFGGPAGQIAIMHQDLVERKHWISEKRFLHALNYCMVLPGPEAQQLATYIGWLMHRTRGGIVAGGLFVLPSLFILIALSWIYMAFGSVPTIAGVLYGIKPAVTSIVIFAAYRIGSRVLKNPWLWLIAAAAFVAIFAANVPFPLIVLIAGIIGHFGGKYAPSKFAIGAGHKAGGKALGPAILDDDTPTPRHALFTWKRFASVLAVFLLIWLAVMGLLIATFGWTGTLTQMAWFFTKAALLTFGGAYAVLPYVYQGAVEHYHWLTGLQMIDGLALGETTPGPLIMVVSFVGFAGGWTKAVFGPDLHIPSVVSFHFAGRPVHRDHSQQSQVHGAADRNYGCGRGRDRQSCSVLRLACSLAARDAQQFRLAFTFNRPRRGSRAFPIQDWRDSRCFRMWPGRSVVAADRRVSPTSAILDDHGNDEDEHPNEWSCVRQYGTCLREWAWIKTHRLDVRIRSGSGHS
jgi:chromate transporter